VGNLAAWRVEVHSERDYELARIFAGLICVASQAAHRQAGNE
jgi:hypothetical protein